MAAIDRNPISTNLTSPFSWVFNMKRSPSLSYFCQAVKLPDVVLDAPGVTIPSILIPEVPDHIKYSDVTMKFIVDINFQNWQEILNWMRGVSDPSGDGVVYAQLQNAPPTSAYTIFSDVSVLQLDSQNNPLLAWTFHRCLPIRLTGPQYDATLTDVNYLTSEVTFRITNFSIGVVGGGS
jgi:T4-like virus tail tube protein gp19